MENPLHLRSRGSHQEQRQLLLRLRRAPQRVTGVVAAKLGTGNLSQKHASKFLAMCLQWRRRAAGSLWYSAMIFVDFSYLCTLANDFHWPIFWMSVSVFLFISLSQLGPECLSWYGTNEQPKFFADLAISRVAVG